MEAVAKTAEGEAERFERRPEKVAFRSATKDEGLLALYWLQPLLSRLVWGPAVMGLSNRASKTARKAIGAMSRVTAGEEIGRWLSSVVLLVG